MELEQAIKESWLIDVFGEISYCAFLDYTATSLTSSDGSSEIVGDADLDLLYTNGALSSCFEIYSILHIPSSNKVDRHLKTLLLALGKIFQIKQFFSSEVDENKSELIEKITTIKNMVDSLSSIVSKEKDVSKINELYVKRLIHVSLNLGSISDFLNFMFNNYFLIDSRCLKIEI